jgi:hypothetical protein
MLNKASIGFVLVAAAVMWGTLFYRSKPHSPTSSPETTTTAIAPAEPAIEERLPPTTQAQLALPPETAKVVANAMQYVGAAHVPDEAGSETRRPEQPLAPTTEEQEASALEAMRGGVDTLDPDAQRRYYQTMLEVAPQRISAYEQMLQAVSGSQGDPARAEQLRSEIATLTRQQGEYRAQLAQLSR